MAGMLVPFGAWVEAEGIEWCSTHHGVADEIGEDRGGACDLADHRPCEFHTLYYRQIRGHR